ncbi:conserved hypothetical protein [Burkholderia pseudomallei 576]|nr:conserved hypothetical protein [Burkholderia pseudomallei 576]
MTAAAAAHCAKPVRSRPGAIRRSGSGSGARDRCRRQTAWHD